jgi:predicted unusual protein kinase regulating ubiquinone biosynthesis (AarF/ABC1/UbiB family)
MEVPVGRDDEEAPKGEIEVDALAPPASSGPQTGRFGRFARLSGLGASVAARHLTQRVVSAFQSKDDAAVGRSRALERSAEHIVTAMGELKGAAMKIGQMLSTDPDLLPPELAARLTGLQKDAPPMELSMVREVVEAALGVPLEEVFSAFSERPIGAASIGQVHRATTRAGQEVAVKVQYPGIADTIESDMKNLGALMNLARASVPKERLDTYLDEVTTVLKRESDYLWEADQLERFHVVFKHVEGVVCPEPIHELTRKDVLVMTFIEGERLYGWFERQTDEALKSRQARRLITAYVEMMHRHTVLHADPHPGNFLVDTEGRIVFLDMGCVREYERPFVDQLLDLMEHMWRGDLEGAIATCNAMGFRVDGVEPEVVWDYLELLLEPLLTDRDFDFGAWPIHERGMSYVKDNPSLLSFAPPREAVFYLRVLAGLRGLLAGTGVKVNAHQLARDWVAAHHRG